jgi:hypothetical protein
MDTLEFPAVQLPTLSPLTVNAASSVFGFLSIFLCYKALVAKQLVRLQSLLGSKLDQFKLTLPC